MDESLSAAKGAGFERGGAGAEKGDMVMKAKIILMLLAVLLLAGQRVTYAAAATRTNIEINLGEEVVIVLEANHTTGYSWQLGGPVDKEILEFSEIRYETGNTKLIGAGGKEVWIFKTLKKGKAEIDLKYTRPWEKDTPPAREAGFTVTVK